VEGNNLAIDFYPFILLHFFLLMFTNIGHSAP
jgi:hypothetical protein